MGTLIDRYRLLGAAFADDGRGDVWKKRLGPDTAREVVELLVFSLAQDVGLPPRDLDRQHVQGLVTEILPGRLEGGEDYCAEIPDVLEDFLTFIVMEEGLGTTWELVSAVGEARPGFESAMKDADRMRLARPKLTPHERSGSKLGRNDPCPCGSGKKYKKCCLRQAP